MTGGIYIIDKHKRTLIQKNVTAETAFPISPYFCIKKVQ